MECLIATKQEHFYDQILIRTNVFIIEQNVPIEEEFDELDKTATQFIVYDQGKAIATARLRVLGDKAKIERVCVVKEARGKHVGSFIMEAMETHAKGLPGITHMGLNAQLTALPFYERLGYEAYGPVFLDAKIEHRAMRKHLHS